MATIPQDIRTVSLDRLANEPRQLQESDRRPNAGTRAQELNTDAIAKGGKAERVKAARKLVNQVLVHGRKGDGRAAGIKALMSETPYISALRATDLALAARGAAPAWLSLTAIPLETLKEMGIVVGPEAIEILNIEGRGPREVSVRELLLLRNADPTAFSEALRTLGGKSIRVNPKTGDVEINPYLVESRQELHQRHATLAHALAAVQDADRDVVVEVERDPTEQQEQESQGQDESGEDTEAEEPTDDESEPQVTVVGSTPTAALPRPPTSVVGLIQGGSVHSDDDIEAAAQVALGQRSRAGSGQSNTGRHVSAQSNAVPAPRDPSGIPIQDLLMLFMLQMAERAEDSLRKKLNETAEAEYAAESGESSHGKSATVLAAEVQVLLQKWKQINEMTSNLMKSLHDMAMTPIRNLR